MPADPTDPTVRPLTAEESAELLRTRGPAGFLPLGAGRPAGDDQVVRAGQAVGDAGPVDADRPEPLGWFTDGVPGGAGSGAPAAAVLLHHRAGSRTHRPTVALLDGPDLDWTSLAAAGTTGRWLVPLATRERAAGAATMTMTPPVPTRAWHAHTVSAALSAAGTRAGTGAHPSTPAGPAGTGFPLDVSDRDAFPADEPVRRPTSVGDLRPDDRGQSGAATAAQLAAADWRPAPGPRPHRAVLTLAGRDEGALWVGQAPRRQEVVQRAESRWVRVDAGEELLGQTAGLVALPLLPGGRPTDRTAAVLWRLLAGFGDRRRLLVARRDDRVLAAVVTVQTGTVTGTGDGPGITERVVGRWAAAAEPEEDPETSDAVAVLSWQLVRAARADGAAALDLGPVQGGLDPHDTATAGLHEAVATGADVQELTGEWSLVLDRPGGAIGRLGRRLLAHR